MQIFNVIIFFKLRTIQQKTVKPTYLCTLGTRKLAEGKGVLIKKRSFNLLRVLYLFFPERWQSTLFQVQKSFSFKSWRQSTFMTVLRLVTQSVHTTANYVKAGKDDTEPLDGQVARRCVLTNSCRSALATLSLFGEAQQISPWLDLQVQFLSSVANTWIRGGGSDTRLDAYGHCPGGISFSVVCFGWTERRGGGRRRKVLKEGTWFV